MRTLPLPALAAPAAFAALALALAAVGAVPWEQAGWAAAAALAAFVPSAFAAPAGWRRRGAEALLLPAGYVLAMVGGEAARASLAAVALAIAAAAAAAAALAPGRGGRPLVTVAFLAVAVRCAGGGALTGTPVLLAALAVAGPALLAAGVARRAGPLAGGAAAVLAASAPLQRHPVAAALVVGAGVALAALPLRPRFLPVRGWLAGIAVAGVLGAAAAPWGGFPFAAAFPAAGWLAAAAVVAALAVSLRAPAAVAGAVWLAATLLLGPVPAPSPAGGGVTLTAADAEAALPPGDGREPYVVELSLAHAGALPQGTPVATLRTGDATRVLRAGVDTAEWAHERRDVHAAHALPSDPRWHPSGRGAGAFWAVSGRVVLPPATAAPTLVRAADLPAAVRISVAAAGPARPASRGDWPLVAWLLAAAAAVAALQGAAGTWRRPAAWLPWAVLALGSALARSHLSPLARDGQAFAADLALAALLAAWLPAARRWLARDRVFLAAAALLVPLALATAHLTPPLWGDEPYHLAMLETLRAGGGLRAALASATPPGLPPLHAPTLALLLLPGFAAAGRAGALALIALAGAGAVALTTRRAATLGAPRSRRSLIVMLALLTAPLVSYATQIWAEAPGALAVAAVLVLAALTPRRAVAATAAAAVATAVKTRLALLTFPPAAVAWARRGAGRRRIVAAALAVSLAGAAGVSLSWVFLGHPLGPFRRLASLLPTDPRQALVSAGGLLFDPAGGLAFAAPLLLVAAVGLPLLWRRGGDGERAALVGLAGTVVALLSSPEWYGGGSPPARYLAAALPAFWLAGALLLRRPPRGLAAAGALLPLALVSWWALTTRPWLSINPGNGGWWLADAAARRFGADGRALVPSFLRLSPATLLVPAALVGVAAAVRAAARRNAAVSRRLARSAVAIWLVAGALAVVVLHLRFDGTVELEDPQVVRLGGRPEPPEGTWSTFLHPGGRRVADGEGVVVPLHLRHHARVRLQGWLDGAACQGAWLLVRWDDRPEVRVALHGVGPGEVSLPPPPPGPRHRLRLVLSTPPGGEAVLDRLVVTP